MIPWAGWATFFVLVLGCLALDLGVFHRKAEAPSLKSALGWTAAWVLVALGFGALVFRFMGHEAGVNYLSGYLVEKSLSLDNIFVIAVILRFFKVAPEDQHRLLFFGVLGALVLRGLMIGLGAALLSRFEWLMYAFGVLLLWTAWEVALHDEAAVHPEDSLALRLARRAWPSLSSWGLALVVVEASDAVFAADSIPAVFGITTDPFIVFTSNVFAVLGLRSLYFALAWLLERFQRVRPAVVAILVFVALKMLAGEAVHVPNEVSLGVIAGLLLLGMAASVVWPPAGTGAR